MTSPFDVLKTVFGPLLFFWWVWLPIFLFILFFVSWLYYIQRKWWFSVERVILEIKPPKEIEQSPKIAEAIFAALWAIQGTVATKAEKYLKGMMQHYVTFEIVGNSGEIKFLIRIPTIFRNFIEAKIYAEYPKAEIQAVDDYVYNLPSGILGRDWDLWGTVLQLTQPNPYPIRTYNEFIDLIPKQPFVDPIANLMEVLGKLQYGEQIWIQIFVRPMPDSWIEEGKAIVGKLIGKAVPKKQGLIMKEILGWLDALRAVITEAIYGGVEPVTTAAAEEAKYPTLMQFLSPGEKEIVESIEKKIAKKAFETKIQFIYFAPRDVFLRPTVAGVIGFFNQFATLNLNGLKPHPKYTTKAFYTFVDQRLGFKKRVMLRLCRLRPYWDKGYVLNTEELATIWHFPTIAVEAPMVPGVEAVKGAPPPELPVV